ncbi:MAG TPA: class I SAM-dependent methyltransferase [Holosporales bacterium]|nr:class I SAM-dependent methyltransferase [Holosporales bacterium]HBW24519.1 class I SAM-dependent methyltransferase [Holosporales bacterium]HCC24119.1 class I SAM-dependent methyltransferase [Holosporales bacterium]HCE95632.1 class I SAM-dependent methyltransferase [Holosporales bacterium]
MKIRPRNRTSKRKERSPLTFRQPEEKEALVVTLNRMGYMLSQPEKYNQAFIDFAPFAPGPVLDIGAAYGLATIPALEKGAFVIANDLDERHLKILKNKLPPSLRKRLMLKPGRMPNGLEFEENSLGAVLASRVLNFIAPEELLPSFEKIFRWLRPGGKFFFLGATPYMGNFQRFIPLYLKRKKEGQKWPGLLENIPFYAPNRACDLPQFIHLLDEDDLRQLSTKVGLIIEEMSYSPAIEEHPQEMKFDGREQIGFIAFKPEEVL